MNDKTSNASFFMRALQIDKFFTPLVHSFAMA